MKFSCIILSLLLAFPCVLAAEDAPAARPYKITVWADVFYDNTGHPVTINFPAKDKYPAQFIKNLQLKLAMTSIEPPVENNLPATFETGVRIEITVTPGPTGASVKVDSMTEEPRVIKKAMDVYPPELVAIHWTGVARVQCKVGLEGKCSTLEILDSPNLPDPARKFALGSMKAWRFKLQKVNGKPVPYTVVVPFSLQFEDNAPVQFLDRR